MMKRDEPRRALGWPLLMLVCGALGWYAAAAAPDAEENLQNSADSDPRSIRSESGYYLGSIRVLPEITFKAVYDDNIFATDVAEESDLIGVLTPVFRLRSDWERHSLRITAGAELGRYQEWIQENYDDYWIDLEGRYDLSSKTNLFGGLGDSFEHEGRDSPDDNLSGIRPTTYRSKNFHAGVSHRQGKLSLRGGGTFESLDFNNVPGLGGTLVNDDRDRKLTGAGLRAALATGERSEVFVQGIYDRRDYDRSVDQNGYRRASQGYRANLGIKRRFGVNNSLEAYVGYLNQDYDDPRFGTVQAPDFAARLTWYPAGRTMLSGRLDRSLNETTVAGSPGYLYTALDARLEHLISKQLRGSLGFSYGLAEFQEIGRDDKLLSASAGLKFNLTRNLFLAADYRFLQRDSNNMTASGPLLSDSFDFQKHQFWLSLGSQLYPVEPRAVTDTKVLGEVEIGAAYQSDDALRFGRYTGMTEQGWYVLGDLDLWVDGEEAQYAALRGRRLGLSSRSLRLDWGDQGTYDAFLHYDQIPFNDFRGRTVFLGVGTDTLALPGDWFDSTPPPILTTSDMDRLDESLRDVEIRTQRKKYALGGRFLPSPYWNFRLTYENETKDGLETLAGAIGSSPGNQRVALLPSPVDQNTQWLNMALAYAKGKGQLELDYRLSLFNNAYTGLSWENPFSADPPGFTSAVGRLAQAPDNQFHQVGLRGSYLLPKQTRLTGSYAFGLMLQNEDFLPYSVSPAGPLPRGSLDGKVYRNTGSLALSSRPWRPLRLNATYRIEQRDNRTEQATYDYVVGDSNRTDLATNQPFDYDKRALRLEAAYRINRSADFSLGYDNDTVKRRPSEVRKTEEDGYRAKLRLTPAAPLDLSLTAGRYSRRGSDYQPLPGENPLLRKYYLADRDRDQAGLDVTYSPTPWLSLSAQGSYAEDDYSNSAVGLTAAKQTSLSVDAVVVPRDGLSGHVYYSREQYRSDQTGSETPVEPDWFVDNEDTTDNIGAGVKVTEIAPGLDLSLDYVYTNARGKTGISALQGSLTAIQPYPDLTSKTHRFKVTADYRLKKKLRLRLSYLHEQHDSSDWALDGIEPGTLSRVLSLGETSPDYKVNVISASLIFQM